MNVPIAFLIMVTMLAPASMTGADGRATFDDCGTLIQGIECPLFDSDNFGVYFIGFDLGGFTIGERVHVIGVLVPDCVTICMEGDGCVFDNTISDCDAVGVDGQSWSMIKARYR